jgi:dihydroorotate dehydrogenase (fumarate)
MNLETNYLGLPLKTPLVPSASPLTGDLDNLRRLEDAGASAVVLPSIFEEQVMHRFNEPGWSLVHGIQPYPAALSYLPNEEHFASNPEDYLEKVRKASSALSIPVIASLSCATPGVWTQFARRLEEAGADALELNVYYVPTDLGVGSTQIEDVYAQIVVDVRRNISIPLAVKIAPFFTSFPNMARRLVDCGADGLVLFNRLFNADIEIEHPQFVHTTRWTTSRDVELPLLGIAHLHGRLGCSLAATGGVHNGRDALKLIFAGADVTMMCSALMIHGIDHLAAVRNEMVEWLEAHGHESLGPLRGSMSLERWPERSAFERANYIWAVGNFVEEIRQKAH